MASEVPFRERISCTIDEACSGTGVARTRLYQMIADKRVQTTKEGRRRLVIVRSLIAVLDPQPEQNAA
jgi:excisionase family DNA binding protein